MLRLELLHSVQREGGRFRSFLLTALKHFLRDEKAKAVAQKRGGGRQFVSWEQAQAEQRFLREPADVASADRLFERRWALTLLEEAMSRLQEESVANGNGERFRQLKGFVSGEKGELSYAGAAERTGLTASAVKSAILRFRRRYHALIREEVAHTVEDPKDIEEELRYLLKFFTEG